MKSVLFPTDFSDESKKAFRFMRLLVQKMNARLTIMNAYLSSNSPRRLRLEEGTINQQIDKRLLQFVKSEFRDKSSEHVRIKSDEGDPVHTISELSKSLFQSTFV